MSSMTTGAAVYDPTRRDQVQAFMPGPHDYFALPAGITKAAAIASIAAALRLMGATEREIAVWRFIADTTDRAAWSATDRAPLNWRRQCDMAREMGLGERHWRNIERALVRYGVLARATAQKTAIAAIGTAAALPGPCARVCPWSRHWPITRRW